MDDSILRKALKEALQAIEESKTLIKKTDKVLSRMPLITDYNHTSSERSKRNTERRKTKKDSS